jgi:beta-mannosidase
VDHYGRRTPSFYPVRRACQPLTVVVAVEDQRVKVFGVNEGPDWKGDLRWGLFALAGSYPLDLHREVSLPANSSTLLADFPLETWQSCGVTTHGTFAILSQNGDEVARDRLFLPFFKEMLWPQPHLQVRCEDGKARFESATFVWRVCLDLDGEIPLPDNFFDVLPGIPTILDWPEGLGVPRVRKTGNLLG